MLISIIHHIKNLNIYIWLKPSTIQTIKGTDADYKLVICHFPKEYTSKFIALAKKMIFQQAKTWIVKSYYWKSFGLDPKEWNVPELNELLEKV
jgi:hypothetical protein